MKLWKAAVACVVTATSQLKKSEESLKSDFFSGGRRLRHRLSCSYSHKLATSSSGSSSPPSCISVSLTFFDNLWSFIEGNFEGNFERKFYCVAFEKKYYRNDFVIKLAWLNNRKLPTVGMQELLRPISVKHSDGFQLPLSNRKQDRVLSSTPNILMEWLRVTIVFLDPYFHLFRQSAAYVVRVTVWLIFFYF